MAKSKPIGVRFDLDKLEQIRKEQGIETPQGVLNYLMNNYRPLKASASSPVKPVAPKSLIKEATPPSNLKGIDLAIWKAEQKVKK